MHLLSIMLSNNFAAKTKKKKTKLKIQPKESEKNDDYEPVLVILSSLHTHCGNSSLRKGKMPAGYETWFQAEDVFLGLKSGCFSLSECLQALEAGFSIQHCPGQQALLFQGMEEEEKRAVAPAVRSFYYLLSPPSGNRIHPTSSLHYFTLSVSKH